SSSQPRLRVARARRVPRPADAQASGFMLTRGSRDRRLDRRGLTSGVSRRSVGVPRANRTPPWHRLHRNSNASSRMHLPPALRVRRSRRRWCRPAGRRTRSRSYLSARDAFQYLVLFTTLYLSAWHLGSLLFDLIEIALPDAADPDYRVQGLARSMRWSVATLLVAFPVFAFMAQRIGREVARDASRRLSAVRRWLTYLTLFIAAAVLIGDLITLVYNLLGGELSLRFVLKVLVAGVISGAIFAWYLADLRNEEREA